MTPKQCFGRSSYMTNPWNFRLHNHYYVHYIKSRDWALAITSSARTRSCCGVGETSFSCGRCLSSCTVVFTFYIFIKKKYVVVVNENSNAYFKIVYGDYNREHIGWVHCTKCIQVNKQSFLAYYYFSDVIVVVTTTTLIFLYLLHIESNHLAPTRVNP